VTRGTADAPGHRAQTVLRMHAIAAGLHASGLDARVHEIRGVPDIRATLRNGNGGGKATEVTVDEDGYVTLAYWNHPDATPPEIVTVITRTLAAITSPP